MLVNGDSVHEASEGFFVNLSNPVFADLGDAQGAGTITNDDPAPSFDRRRHRRRGKHGTSRPRSRSA